MSKVITITALVAASAALASAADWQTVEYTLSHSSGSGDDSVTAGNASFASFTIGGDTYTTIDASSYNWSLSFNVAISTLSGSENLFSLSRSDTGADGYGVLVTNNSSTYEYAITADARNKTVSSSIVSTSDTSVSVVFSWDALNTTLSLTVGSDTVTLSGVSAESATIVAGGTDGSDYDSRFWSNGGNESITGISLQVQQVPEPSMFGVLAGLGALGFVAARRRRNRKA
ncbi:MAG: PEP-CTERM sorting domain-containing protein [Opitutae bacterium]|nr:PEP-CTERM sorting domain-containing protein [Opitutae bacterium]